MTKIGILALQGAFAEHEQVLKALGVETVQIRNRQDWEAHADLDGLIPSRWRVNSYGETLA